MNRNVILLSGSMALGMSSAPVIVLLGGIVGVALAPTPALSTLPVAMLVVGVALFTVPAALIMRITGRRKGFMAASLLAALACVIGIYAIHIQSFVLFCTVAFLIGGNLAFVQQYRFAAAESVEPVHVSRAVSIVLLGGVVAAFIGPELAKHTREMLPYGLYSGSFASLAALNLANITLLFFLKEPRTKEEKLAGDERPLGVVIRQPLYLTAVMAALVAYGVMSFIMTATPVSMHVIDDFSIEATAWVIQSHVMAMFIPSLFTGFLIGRYGLTKVMLGGITLMTFCVALALIDRHFIHYWAGLVLLGVGWNFLFIGGTTLLTRCYSPAERFKAQAVNEFTVFGFQALA
ncbi:MFS transporter, partial [bacterium]|nr:MFS transporter [bacterium]